MGLGRGQGIVKVGARQYSQSTGYADEGGASFLTNRPANGRQAPAPQNQLYASAVIFPLANRKLPQKGHSKRKRKRKQTLVDLLFNISHRSKIRGTNGNH